MKFHNLNFIFDSQPQRPQYAPADVVSIAIAKRLAAGAKNGISEKHLQYGSLKDPIIDEKQGKQTINVNEESFYDTKGNVLQLEPYLFKQPRQVSSEESSEEEKPKKNSHSSLDQIRGAHLEFDDIGYKPYEQSSKPRYVVVKNSDPVKHGCNKAQSNTRHHHKKGKSCDCYKDLVVDQSAVSEQSMSYESSNGNQYGRFST